MARNRTIEAQQQHDQAAMPIDADASGFGAEFRELARQRRFVRSDGDDEVEADADARESAFWARTAEPVPTAQLPTAAAPTPASAPIPAAASAPASAPDPSAARTTPAPRVRAPRMSEDQRSTLLELGRMSDRLVESREALAIATTRVDHLDSELGTARDGLAAANDRLMASRVLVLDAQRTTRELAERAAWLEGRVEMLQEALELAVNASVVTRWKWRREQRARARA